MPEVAVDEATLVSLVSLLRGEAAAVGEGEWVIGSHYDQSKTTNGRTVDRWRLDEVVPDHPVLLVHVASHWGVLGRDGEGRLNGVVYEQALFDVSYPSLARTTPVVPPSTTATRLRSLRRAFNMFHAAGITADPGQQHRLRRRGAES